MRKRIIYGFGIVLLAILVTLVVWQGSFDFGSFGPSNPQQTFTLWAISTLIFILTVTLGFMLARNFIKLYVERHSNVEGSRIRTKLVLGALALTFTPVVFLVIFSINVVNRNIDKWFSRPAEDIRLDLIAAGTAMDTESRDKAIAISDWLASLPEVEKARNGDLAVANSFQQLCINRRLAEIRVDTRDGGMIRLCKVEAAGRSTREHRRGDLAVVTIIPLDLARTQADIQEAIRRYDQLAVDKRAVRRSYLLLLTLITLFILFFATWLALFLAKQISIPISALLGAAKEVRKGNLDHRVQVNAMDELASLVRAFNEMTQELSANSRELDNRRRFTEAILESIPTGVLSLSSDGRIQRVNRALKGLFPAEQVDRATRLQDLFSSDDTIEIQYLMNRARRMGVAASQFDIRTDQRVMHLSATVAALEDNITSGFVLVLEDTSDMLRAQKAAAWHEIARRIAHELKNPLTPIALCAERIARQLDKPFNSDKDRILRECSAIILSEVETVRTLVDEFSQFSRFPSAQPVPSDLNEVIDNALAVFGGRLDGIQVIKRLASGLPQVNVDREQFKRMVVNLIDNAAEAMRESLVKRLYVGTTAPTPELVELTIADTGCGISRDDKERLFLPYFTTKSRGTGLGLAIVNHIVAEHRGHIRVEDNSPAGARFIVELTALTSASTEVQAAGAA
jgi:two-component system, NtrC family, nitrogen regulation sensor histidine kinase NtrY